ncbi:preprotein translocase subunit SecA [bacterium]|nr:preprotein translocase subunit SecA [bacterium]
MGLLDLFSKTERELRKFRPLVARIGALEEGMRSLSDDKLAALTPAFRERLSQGASLEDLLPEAFAAIREAAWRRVGLRPYDVQLMGGICLHQGRIAEMTTGEGKTLVATLPTYLNALSGKGVHVITVNDYLARRDAEWMGPIHTFMGLTVGSLQHGTPKSDRRATYSNDIVYGTNSEFGFDYLRDHMIQRPDEKVQRDHSYAIVDEVDSILVDEARTPLIISGPPSGDTGSYQHASKAVRLLKDADVEVEEKSHSVSLTEKGTEKIQRAFGVENLYDFENNTLNQRVNQALKARWLYQVEKDYIIHEGGIIIVDEFTGRLMFGRRYGDGLHQAIEAKEGVHIRAETLTVATITIQNYFRLYTKLSGMTGTAKTEEREFIEIYDMDVLPIPTNMPLQRKKERDEVYKTEKSKYSASVQKIRESYDKGQPVLVGTVSIENSELISKLLRKAQIPHQVLNAKHHEKEANIIAQAGRWKAVTIATNMAGRGTDILLGGNPEFLARDILSEQGHDPFADDLNPEAAVLAQTKAEKICKEEATKVIQVGGLHVLGTERHEARRIDNQLMGRSGRQGDPGSSQFLLSLEDDIMRRFAVDRVEAMMERFDWPDDEALWHPLLDRMIENVQKRIEGHHYEVRKSLLKYDDVLNEQRRIIYLERSRVMEESDYLTQVQSFIEAIVDGSTELHASPSLSSAEWNKAGLVQELSTLIPLPPNALDRLSGEKEPGELIKGWAFEALASRKESLGDQLMDQLGRWASLRAVDRLWMHHLTDMTNLREGVSLRGYGRVDPLTVYAKEAYELFNALVGKIQQDIVRAVFMAKVETRPPPTYRQKTPPPSLPKKPTTPSAQASPYEGVKEKDQKVGRNAPCPCGSGKKFKKCCGR